MKKFLQFVQMIFWLVFALSAVFGVGFIDTIGCPSGTFMSGSAASESGTWPFLFRLISAMAAGWFPSRLALYFVCRMPVLRRQFASDNPHFDLRGATLRAVIIVPPALLAMFLATFDRLCVSPSEISTRRYLWSTPETERWSDVVGVLTACRPGSRGSWREAYVLIFRDRRAVDLKWTYGFIGNHRKDIFTALHGRTFAFDDRRVDGECIEAFRDMATTRP